MLTIRHFSRTPPFNDTEGMIHAPLTIGRASPASAGFCCTAVIRAGGDGAGRCVWHRLPISMETIP